MGSSFVDGWIDGWIKCQFNAGVIDFDGFMV